MPDEEPSVRSDGIGDDGEPLWAWLKARDEAMAANPEKFAPGVLALTTEPDYGAGDYVRLPDFGVGYYSLEDAALLSALDMWSAGRAPGVPAEGLAEDDDGAHDHQDDPLIRAALEPLRAQLLAALVRSAESGHLKVEVRGRTLADSRLMPGRTFVHLSDLVEWLAVHGHERGDIIDDAQESTVGDPWLTASAIAEDRAQLRIGHLPAVSQPIAASGWAPDGAKAEIQSLRLHVAHLAQQLDEARRGGRTADKPLKTRERRTLLVVIAALCRRAGIDPSARGAAAEVASATAELGVPISDDTIRAMLRAIPDALG